jgi:hypothetical protein
VPVRHFPPLWSVGEFDAGFIVRDQNGQQLAYIYFEHEPRPAIGRQAAHQRRGAANSANIAKLPELLRR